MKRPLKDEFGPPKSHVLSTGLRCESPFWVPEAAGAMLFGTLDLARCRDLMQAARYEPVAATNGRALGCLWLSEFGSSTCGPYQELTVTFLVRLRGAPAPAIPWVNRWTPFAAQQLPDVFVCEYILVLNNRHAIAYGRELHGFDKHPGELGIADLGDHVRFRVSEDTVPTVSGRLRVRADLATQARMLVEVGRALGVRKTGQALREKLHPLRVVTPPTLMERRSDIFFRGRPVLQPWARGDELEVGPSPVGRLIGGLDFKPTTVQVLRGGEGVMPFDVP
ncbi:MAG: acetoacetate decarboxylase family protein [Myxococcota bacterium]